MTIGFIDVGFYPHPDLMQPRRRIKAYADVARSVPVNEDFFQARPSAWHGTMTACVAAGNGYVSGGRFRGLASEADVVLIRAASEDHRVVGKLVAQALRFPLRHTELGIRVVSVSLGVSHDDPDASDVNRAVRELTEAGVVVVAAAGNDPGAGPEPPGLAAEAITVGGSNDQNTRDGDDDTAWPSSYLRGTGPQKPELVAPAILVPAPMLPGTSTAREARPLFDLISLLEEQETERRFEEHKPRRSSPPSSLSQLEKAIIGRIEAQKYISPDYQHVDGTSFAAPITASVVAQMIEANPKLTPAQIKRGLALTAEPLEGVAAERQGAGVLQPRKAVEWALAKGKPARRTP